MTDDGRRPIVHGEAWCFTCMKTRVFNLNSNGDSPSPEYECQTCGHKTDYLVR